MSLTSDILTLNSALQAFTYGQSITAENIANVNTPGYTTQVLDLSSLQDFGGVAVAGVGSTRNVFLYNQLYGQLALQGYTTAQMGALNQLTAILPEVSNPLATTGLSAAMNNLAGAWKTLSANPASIPDQTTVLNDMQTLAGLFETDSNQLYTLQQNLDTQIQQSVNQVNSLEDQILNLNKQIVALGGVQDAQTSVLIDQRQVAAQQLTGLTGAAVNYGSNGAMIVTFNGGTLVDGVQSYHLGTMPSQTTPGLLDIGYVSVPGSSQMADVTADITSGTLGGLLYSNNTLVKQAVLGLNKMASGIIQFSNEVNQSSAALDGSINALFTGTEASNIAVNPVLATNLDYILATNDTANPGNLAAAQAAMNTLNMYSEIETINPTPGQGGIDATAGAPINPALSMGSQLALFATQPVAAGGTLVINSGGNAVNIAWTNADSLNQIVAAINAASGGAFYATLQTGPTGQFVHLYSNAPLSIYNASGNLGNALGLNAVLFSSAPINNVPSTGVNQVSAFGPPPAFAPQALDSVSNTLALFTQPVAPVNQITGLVQGTVQIDGNVATWSPNQTLPTILGAIQTAAPAGSVEAGFNAATQQVSIDNMGPPTYFANLTAANPLQSVSISDLTGNLTQVLNLDTNTNATKVFAQLVTTVQDNTAGVANEQSQANALVYATESLQNMGGPPSPLAPNGQPQAPVSNVNLDAQLAQAAVYQDAYDAAVRMQYVLESMLNYLITQVGSPNASSGPVVG